VVPADGVHPFEQYGCPYPQPRESFLADLVMFGIPRLHIGFVERVEPGALAVLIARERIGQTAVLFLGERAQELDVV
jgi:hypothetical protein